ncbi:hypothetical protein M0805_001335 [Coniferiporia weirii]|nr:hypothetical protein M0805_001335 [Coniferiporia weirii]
MPQNSASFLSPSLRVLSGLLSRFQTTFIGGTPTISKQSDAETKYRQCCELYDMNTPSSPHQQFKPSASSAGRQSAFQNRANNLVKRLGLLTSKFGASTHTRTTDDNAKECIQTHPYRGTRSMDLMRNEPYLSSPMLAVNFKSQPLDRRSVDDSDRSHSQSHINYAHVKTPSLGGTVAQGLTVATVVAGAGLGPRSDIQSAAGAVNQSRIGEGTKGFPPNTHANTRSKDSQIVGESAESLQRSVAANAGPESVQHPVYDTPSESPSSSRRPAVPRLRTLPPLNLNMRGVEQEQRTLRLSPSVIVRPPPFPILELPALPDSAVELTSSSRLQMNVRARPAARLNSMPMLPMEGQDERENDPDHENYGLEEDEEGDEDEDSEEEMSGATADSDDDDDDVSGRPSLSSLSSSMHGDHPGRARGLAPLLPNLLPMPTFSSLLGSSVGTAPSSAETGQYPASSEQASKLQRDEAATPKAANGKRDYFSFSFAGAPDDHTKDGVYEGPYFKASSPRTPTARDYSQASNRPHMLSVASPSGSDARMDKNGINPTKAANAAGTAHLPMADSSAATASSSKRPGIYQQASKSMVELFTSATAPTRDGVASGSIGMDVKGKRTDADASLQGHISNAMSGNGKAASNKRGINTSINPSTSTFCTSSAGKLTAADSAQAHFLRRQHSMPSFAGSGPPPPYPIFSRPDPNHPNNPDRFMPMPREDEGKEALPPYTNDIRLTAVLPRKMEFTAPGVQAQDRKWRRLHCVLEGTAFKVYEAPRRASGVGAIVGWWERKVGAGDVSLNQTSAVNDTAGGPTPSIIKKGPKRRMKWEEELQAEEERNAVANAESGPGRGSGTGAMDMQQDPHMHRSKRNIASALLHPNRSRISSRAPSPSSSFTSPRSSFQIARSSVDLSTNSASSAPTSARPSADLSPSASASNLSSPANSHFRRHVRPEGALQPQPKISHSRSQSQPINRTQDQNSVNTLLEPGEGDVPLRVYSLQHSESGLASDYTKRRNVVRVRMEGEQFLLQCTNVAAVVEWIEGLQAAANISLDLDERPMPKGPIFPRRRRRRRAQPAANRPTGTTS